MNSNGKYSRRKFIHRVGAVSTGLVLSPYFNSNWGDVFAEVKNRSELVKVAVTQASTYDRVLIKQKIQHLLSSLGGISDIMKPGKKVAVKINLTGGSGQATSSKLGGKPITDVMWTHPEVLRAVGESIIDCGVSPGDIYIVEALWDTASFNNFGYLSVQQALGAKMVDLNVIAPYTSFGTMNVGVNSSYYNSFTLNRILSEVDVYVSIPKMKQHYEAGVTASLKNQIGIVPKSLYTTASDTSRRAALHTQGGVSNTHLPRSICDLNFARPMHLAVIDGVKNARGGEGTWNPTFQLYEDHLLLAGKDPVATDSITTKLMSIDPEAATLPLPAGGVCDNYLDLLRQKGMGTNLLREIEIVGDGAGLVNIPPTRNESQMPDDFLLLQNFPNPFNPSTIIRFYLPRREHVRLRVYSMLGQELETIVDLPLSAGLHEVHWTPNNIASGAYFYTISAGGFIDSKELIYLK